MRRIAGSIAVLLALLGCGVGGGDDGAPIVVRDVPPELVFCRARREAPHSATEIRTATRHGLDERTAVPDRAGVESGVRVHPDGVTVVFSRERRSNDPDSREIYVASLDGSRAEARLTADARADESPCWIDAGARLCFVSTRDGAGIRRLWTMDVDGQNPTLLFDDGSEQTDPDERNGRLAFARRDPLLGAGAPTELWVIERTSGVAMRWTDGGGGATGGGDTQPAWSHDGSKLLFTRALQSAGIRSLHVLDVATRVVTRLGDIASDHSLPRWSPSGDAIFVALSAPVLGLAGLRLWELAADGSDATMVLPDVRFDYVGIDTLPALQARPTLTAAETVPLDRAEVTTIGEGNAGSTSALERADGLVATVLTGLFDRRDVAGLRISVPLPVTDPLEVGRIDVAVLAAISRIDGDSVLRLTLDNFGANRNDTVLERRPTSTDLATYAFSSQSLAHLDRDGRLTLTIIADLPEGARAELSVDRVSLTIRRR